VSAAESAYGGRERRVHARRVGRGNGLGVREGGDRVVETLVRAHQAILVLGEQERTVEADEDLSEGLVGGQCLPPVDQEFRRDPLDDLLGELFVNGAVGRLRDPMAKEGRRVFVDQLGHRGVDLGVVGRAVSRPRERE
jgi:hypothetical protein